MQKNGFKKHLLSIFLREFFQVCIIKNLAEAARAISAFLKNSLVQINFKLNSKPYDYLYVLFTLPMKNSAPYTRMPDLFTDAAGILNSVVSNSYYGMLRGQISTYLPPEHPIIAI